LAATTESSTAPGATADDDAVTAVVSLYAKHQKIYPRAVSGWFAAWRWALVFATQLVYYGLPWLQWNGRQAVLFDLEARRFYLFGAVLYPQDFIYLTALLLISALALFLFTAVAGRLWCGYACPQTVYTELFLWLERKFEGDRNRRIRLDASDWSFDKAWRKSGKQLSWVALSLWTGLTFVGYFTPIRELVPAVAALELGPWQTFWIAFYSLATYGNAGFLREQVCKYMCPYARFQSAMFDRDTLVIGYDAERGEPRGTRSRKIASRAQGLGDCIDCRLCVQVCPTGIDIRKGLQYECIGCAACIDACDGVMDKMQYPRGLIRYVTQNGLAGHWSGRRMWARVLRPRVLVYGAILGALTIALLSSLALRNTFRVDVVRDRATLARQVEDGAVENVYRLQVMNATESAQRFQLAVSGIAGIAIAGATEVQVGPADARWATVAVRIPHAAAAAAGPGAHPIVFRIRRAGAAGVEPEQVADEKSTFVIPR
jgi:cytochrome c oxidase accessory protein FixG